MITVKSVALFLSRSLLDCTVGARSAKLNVSTRASTKHVFASPEIADLVSALGQVFRSFVSGAPVWIPHWLKCSGRTTWRCLAFASHGTWKLSREASSAGLLMDGTRPNQGSSPRTFSYLTNSFVIPIAIPVAPSALTSALCAAVLSK